MPDVRAMEPPGAVDCVTIFAALGAREPLALLHAMRRRRQNVGCAIRNPDSGAGKRDLHHVFGKIAGRVGHRLVRGRDAAACRVIVSTEMSGDATARGRVEQSGQTRFASPVEDRLGGFDHDLESKQTFLDVESGFERFEHTCQRGRLLRDHDFWQSDDKIFREPAPRGLAQSADKKIEGANASFAQLGRKWLDAYADEGRQGALAHSTRHLFRGKFRVLVFFGVGAVPVAVLEVDAKIFDGLTLEFFEHASITVYASHAARFSPRSFSGEATNRRCSAAALLSEAGGILAPSNPTARAQVNACG